MPKHLTRKAYLAAASKYNFITKEINEKKQVRFRKNPVGYPYSNDEEIIKDLVLSNQPVSYPDLLRAEFVASKTVFDATKYLIINMDMDKRDLKNLYCCAYTYYELQAQDYPETTKSVKKNTNDCIHHLVPVQEGRLETEVMKIVLGAKLMSYINHRADKMKKNMFDMTQPNSFAVPLIDETSYSRLSTIKQRP